MNHGRRISGTSGVAWLTGVGALAALLIGLFAFWPVAQTRAGISPERPANRQRTPAKPLPLTLTITDGTNASYRVREQLAGINFPNDAVGSSTAVTGKLVIRRDGSIDSGQSKLTFDLRTLKSDQPMRDGFIQQRTLQTDHYPMAVFVPKTIEGMPNPLRGQFGFQLKGDMTIHGVTAPVTWQGIATVDNRHALVAGRATTTFKFETFGMTIPKLARLLSVNDNITLAVEFRFKIS